MPRLPTCETCGGSWKLAADAVADEGAHDRAALALGELLDRGADVAEARALAHLGDAELERAPRRPR